MNDYHTFEYYTRPKEYEFIFSQRNLLILLDGGFQNNDYEGISRFLRRSWSTEIAARLAKKPEAPS